MNSYNKRRPPMPAVIARAAEDPRKRVLFALALSSTFIACCISLALRGLS